MKRNTEIVFSYRNDAELEMEVSYSWKDGTSDPGDPGEFEFKSVCIRVLDRWIDILKLLRKEELDYIQEQLSYYE